MYIKFWERRGFLAGGLLAEWEGLIFNLGADGGETIKIGIEGKFYEFFVLYCQISAVWKNKSHIDGAGETGSRYVSAIRRAVLTLKIMAKRVPKDK